MIREVGQKQCLSTAAGRAVCMYVWTSHQRLFLVNVIVADFYVYLVPKCSCNVYIPCLHLVPFGNLESECVIIRALFIWGHALYNMYRKLQFRLIRTKNVYNWKQFGASPYGFVMIFLGDRDITGEITWVIFLVTNKHQQQQVGGFVMLYVYMIFSNWLIATT